MKYRILIFFILLIRSSLSFCQLDSIQISVIEDYPEIRTYGKLGERINDDFDQPIERAAAIYYWIGSNISYDLKARNNGKKYETVKFKNKDDLEKKREKINQKTAKDAYRSKKAICHGYSTLFKELCELSGIECQFISGHSKTTSRDIGRISIADHAWNAVKIENIWHLVDVTWSAGYVDHENDQFVRRFTPEYFLMEPDLFFLQHYPKDTNWLLIERSRDEFKNLPLYHNIGLLQSRIEVVHPQTGIITKTNEGNIRFTLKSDYKLPDIVYQFGKDVYAHKTITKREGNIHYFDIPLDGRRNGTICIYLGGIAFAEYRLKIS